MNRRKYDFDIEYFLEKNCGINILRTLDISEDLKTTQV